MSKYNATVYQRYSSGALGTFVAHVETINDRLQMLRSNSLQCTGMEDKFLSEDIPQLGGLKGDAAYDVYIRSTAKDSEFVIVLDDCQGYKDRLLGLALPPEYQV